MTDQEDKQEREPVTSEPAGEEPGTVYIKKDARSKINIKKVKKD